LVRNEARLYGCNKLKKRLNEAKDNGSRQASIQH